MLENILEKSYGESYFQTSDMLRFSGYSMYGGQRHEGLLSVFL
jgi:hypothetical protein